MATALLLTVAAKIYATRDIGTGVLPARDSAPPRLRLLSSSLAQGLRSERGTILAWLLSVGGFAFILVIIGLVSLALATWEYRKNMLVLRAQYPKPPQSLAGFVAALISLLGVTAFLAMLFRQ